MISDAKILKDMKKLLSLLLFVALFSSHLYAAGSKDGHVSARKEPSFLGVAVSFGVMDWEFGPKAISYNPKVLFKVGSSRNTLNLITGLQYKYNMGYSKFKGSIESVVNRDWQNSNAIYCSPASSQLQLPLIARVNLSKRGSGPWFIGAGLVGNYNFDARIVDKRKGQQKPERYIDRKLVNPFNYELNAQIGKKSGRFELYFYFRYDLSPLYDLKYTEANHADFYERVAPVMNDNWRVGVAGVIHITND